MTITQLAGSLPRSQRFREYLDALAPSGTPISEDGCAEYIRQLCGVQSRRDLATNPEAAERFHNLIRKPFVEWCEQQSLQPA